MSSTIAKPEAAGTAFRHPVRRQSLREYAEIFAMLLPNLILVAVFIIYPFVWTIKFGIPSSGTRSGTPSSTLPARSPWSSRWRF